MDSKSQTWLSFDSKLFTLRLWVWLRVSLWDEIRGIQGGMAVGRVLKHNSPMLQNWLGSFQEYWILTLCCALFQMLGTGQRIKRTQVTARVAGPPQGGGQGCRGLGERTRLELMQTRMLGKSCGSQGLGWGGGQGEGRGGGGSGYRLGSD